ncbi:hypothetical protein NW066_02125 [Mycoplasmopsis felis]|uniref:hypothetical protein n=1 Tax=Mycoplasmopsis felis TaxID=33923 RepID=UPI0021AE595E|nr:hypothetical protein [Mycoplasmopsis felis]UWV85479.1 hypothetical protein NW066_02125 [Mycoplasmopsis felis]
MVSFHLWFLDYFIAAAAMILAAPKENRKLALGTVVPAAFTSIITGLQNQLNLHSYS